MNHIENIVSDIVVFNNKEGQLYTKLSKNEPVIARSSKKQCGSTGVHGEIMQMETTNVKEFVDDLKTEWKSLWQDRIEDELRAEGITKYNYSKLEFKQGIVIFAKRDC